MDENRSPDESTPLLPQGNTLLGTSGPQITEVTVQENAVSGRVLESHSSRQTMATEPDMNRPDRPWAGLPKWLGWIALLALFLGCMTNIK
jgi:hypothetical protein